MNLDELQASLAAKIPPPGTSPLVQALWHDAKGDWARAHEIVQSLDTADAARLHAYLHRKEGDVDNAQYWYQRAGTALPEMTLDREWRELAIAFCRVSP